MVRSLRAVLEIDKCVNGIDCGTCGTPLVFDENDIMFEQSPVSEEEWKYYGTIICPYCDSQVLVCVDGGNRKMRYNLVKFYNVYRNKGFFEQRVKEKTKNG